MTPTFKNLPHDKKNFITHAIIDEFSEYGYIGASTNRIVEKAGISKGSLFKYFESKDDLYYYVIKMSINKIYAYLSTHFRFEEDDIFERITSMVEVVFEFYMDNPKYFKLFFTMMEEGAINVQERIMDIYIKMGQDVFFNLFKGVNMERYVTSFEDTITLIKWYIIGLKSHLTLFLESETPQKMRQKFIPLMNSGFEILQHGLIKK